MAGQQLELILAARDDMTPVLDSASRSVGTLQNAVKAYGTATPAAKAATSELLATLRASRGATDSVAEGFGSATEAAKHLAKGGLAELLSEIPVVGNALSRLATGFSGFPLLAGGVVGAGIGIIKMLTDMDAAATKDLQGITALSQSIGTDFRAAQLEAAKVTAEATNQRMAAIELGYQKELAAAESAKDQTIATAQAELDEVNARWFASFATRQIAQAKFLTAKAAAEGKAADDAIAAQARENAAILALLNEQIAAVQGFEQAKRSARAEAESGALTAEGKTTQALQVSINEQVALIKDGYAKQVEALRKLFVDDVQSFNEQRVVAEQTMQAKLIALEQKAAESRRQILQQSTTDALTIFQGLGDRFADIAGKLGAAQFVQNLQNQMRQLQAFRDAIAGGDETMRRLGITTKDVDDGITELGQQIKDVLNSGVVPMKQAVQELAVAQEKVVDAGEAWLKSMEGISPQLDELVAKTRALKAAEEAALHPGASASSSAGAVTSSGGSSGQTAGDAALGLNPQNPFAGSPAPSLHGYNLDSANAPTPSGGAGQGGGGMGSAVNQYPGGSYTGPGPSGSYLDNSGVSIPSFDTGGLVPGPAGRPMLAWVHGGEEVVAREATRRFARGSTPTIIQIARGAITISGTVIDQQRAWASLVETLGQSLDARAARRR